MATDVSELKNRVALVTGCAQRGAPAADLMWHELASVVTARPKLRPDMRQAIRAIVLACR
jgi:hypothetical protein